LPPARSGCAGDAAQEPGEAGIQVVLAQFGQPFTPGCALSDHARLAQDPEVVGGRRLRDRQAEGPAWTLAAALARERPDDLQSHGVAEGLEDVLQSEVLAPGAGKGLELDYLRHLCKRNHITNVCQPSNYYRTMTIEQFTAAEDIKVTRTQRRTIAITGAALFMVVLDNLIVASTLPAIQESLGASLESLEWVLNAYILAFGVLMLTAAALGERYGRRRVFIAGVVLFTVSSAAGAVAPNVETLIAARAVEGIGGAMVTPLTLTLLTAAFPAERRSAALGAWSSIAGIGVAAGPIAGGALTSALSWHWIFWVNVPIGIVVAILAPRMLAESRGRHERLDLGGLAFASTGLFALIFATVRANEAGWMSPQTLGLYAAGTALLAAFIRWEGRSDHPMVPLRLFSSSEFSGANIANFLLAVSMFAGFVMVVQFFASVRGEAPIEVGVHSLFWTAGPMIVSPYAARWGRSRGALPVATLGMALIGLGMLSLALVVHPSAGALTLAPALVAVGVGIGLVLPNIVSIALAAVPEADMGKASGVLNTARQAGAVVGVTVGIAVFQAAGGAGASATTDGIRAALLVAAASAGAGTLAVALGARRRAEAGLTAAASA
jgi:EmrB/QacA subfamily drug resistance transporter